jgi:hypothetical protein
VAFKPIEEAEIMGARQSDGTTETRCVNSDASK